MKDKRDKEKRTIRMAYLMPIWLVGTLGILGLIWKASGALEAALETQNKVSEKTMEYTRLAEQMQNGSDILTNAVWRFVATGQEKYAEAYLAELEENQSRDKAIRALEEKGLSSEELAMMRQAKEDSDVLTREELRCIKLIYVAQGKEELPDAALSEIVLTAEEQALTAEEKRSRASRYVFGEEYLGAKDAIESQITLFTRGLEQRQSGELARAIRETQWARAFQRLVVMILFVWCTALLLFIYFLLIRPIRGCCEELGKADGQKRPLTLQGPYELRHLIHAFNGALEHIQVKNEEIYNIQMVDPVTGGYTGVRFDREVAEKIREGRAFAFVSMDIRRFKVINDVYGSEEGDKVLREVYEVMQSCMEEGEAVSRIESDIFNLIMEETKSGVIEERIEKIARMLDQIHSRDRQCAYHVFLNCGVYQVHPGEKDIVVIRDRANAARNISKSETGYLNGCVFYTELERQRLVREQVMENQMEEALARGEFLVYLQPKVRLTDERVVGAEALVRWDSRELGFASPGEFITLFERNGFIKKLDYYMFRKVCGILRGWLDEGKPVVPVSVNLSKQYIRNPGVVEELKEIQREYHIPGSLIEFELTEAMALEDMERFKEIVGEIHAAGWRCSMDDFGSGYSSLNMLKEIPVEILKLDRGFFVGGDTERARNVIRSVIQMAKELHMEVVSEGVESRALVTFLKEQGCDMVQGYVFYKPMAAELFENRILNGNKVGKV